MPALAPDRIHRIKINDLEPDPQQPRTEFLAKPLEELAANIKARGIQQPITVRKHPDDPKRFLIKTGERRWRAAKLAGLKLVPCIIDVVPDDAEDVLVDQLSENNLREGLNDLDLAGALKQLRDAGKGPAEIVALLSAHGISMSRPAVSNTLRLLELPEWAQKMLRDGKIGGAHARQILRAAKYPAWLDVVRERLEREKGELTVNEVDDAVTSSLRDKRVARELREWFTSFDWKRACASCEHRLQIKGPWGGKESFCLAPAEYDKKQAEAEAKAAAREEKKANTPAETATDPADVKPRKLKVSDDGLITLGNRVGTYSSDEFRPLTEASFDTLVCAECPHKRTGSRTGKKDEDAHEVCTFTAHFDKLQKAGAREAGRRERFKEALDELLLPHLQPMVADPERHRVQAAVVAYVGLSQPLAAAKPRPAGHSYVPKHQLRDSSAFDHDGARVVWNLGVALERYAKEPAGEDPTRELARIALPLLHYEQRRELALFLGVKLADFYRPTERLAKLYRKQELVHVIDPHHAKTGWKPGLPSRSVEELQQMFVEGGQPIPPNLIALWTSPIGNIERDELEDRDDGPRCNYCGCSHMEPCELENGPCAWHAVDGRLGDDQHVCSNPVCVADYRAQFPDVTATEAAA